MRKSDEEIQEEWYRYERAREERRKNILRDLKLQIQIDSEKIKEMENGMRELKTEYESNRDPALAEKIKQESKEIKSIRHRIEHGNEMLKIIGDETELHKTDTFLDDIMDMKFDSHGGAYEGSRLEYLPLKGMGLVAINEIIYKFKQWKKRLKKEDDL